MIAPSLSPAQTEIGARSPQVAKWRRLSSSAGGSLEPGLQRTCREASSASFSRGALFLPRSERALRMLAGDTGLAPASRADVLCSEMASARVPARLEPGSSNVHRVAAVRGSAGVQPSSARFGCFTVPWLIAGVIGAAAGCTLTEKPFEPTPIDDAETRSEPTLPAGSVAADDVAVAEQDTGLPTTGNNTEGVPNVRPPTTQASMLEPGGASEQTDADAGAPPLVEEKPEDAGATVDAAPPVVDPPIVEPPPVEPPGEPCTGLSFEGSCYELFDSFLAWDLAEQQCVAWGGHLASIGAAEENAFLNGWPAELGLANADGSGIWIGGSDAQRDGQFLWVDGSPFSFAGWAPGQPDNGAGVDCIEKRNDGAGQWYDRRCVDSLRYLCERPL